MIDWLIVARSNQYGLTRDAEILRTAIESAGRSTDFAQRSDRGIFERLMSRRRARRTLHLERAFPSWFSAGEETWIVPNQERFPARHVRRLKKVARLLAKTRHAEAIFSALGVPTTYLGFTSEDRFSESETKDWNRFFHLAGGSTLKGTEDIVALWHRHSEWPELVLVQKADNAPRDLPSNIRLISGYLDDANLRVLQNQCGIHLCPSRAEGWGHHIVEGLSAGSVVITTDAPPMNELVDPTCGVLVAASPGEPRHLGFTYAVDRQALERAIDGLMALPAADKARLGKAARERFLAIDAGFRDRVRAIFLDPTG